MRWAVILCLGLSACSLALDFDTVQQPCDDLGKCLDGYTCDTATRKCVRTQRTACSSDSQCPKSNAVCDGHYCTTDVMAVSGGSVVAPDLSCVGKTPSTTATYAITGCVTDAFAQGGTPPAFDPAAQLTLYQANGGSGVGSQLATPTLAQAASCPGTGTGYDATGTLLPGGTWLNASYEASDPLQGAYVTTYTEHVRLPAADGGASLPVYALGAAAFTNLAGAQPPVLAGGMVVDCQGRPLANATVKMTGTLSVDGGFAPAAVEYLNADGTAATSRKATNRSGYFGTFDLAESSTGGMVAQGTVNGVPTTLSNLYLYVPARPSTSGGFGGVAAWVRASP